MKQHFNLEDIKNIVDIMILGNEFIWLICFDFSY